MANKTVVFNSQQLAGRTDLVLYLININTGALGNGSGTAVTAGTNGHFSCVITEAVTGWWLVVVKDAGDVPLLENGVVHFKTDTVGTYPVNDITILPDKLDEIETGLNDIESGIEDIKVILDQPENPDKVMVNQDFGGADNLMYTLDGEPVADALIELFLYSDYIAGNYNSNRIDSTRQRIDGTWAKAFYLDPQEYVVRFYRTGVAGPDAFKLVVSFDADEIDITPL